MALPTAQPKQLRIVRSMGHTLGVGWMRDDAPMFHMFANVAPGEKFQPSDGHGGPHWPCKVCIEHGYTDEDFHGQIVDALKKGPEE